MLRTTAAILTGLLLAVAVGIASQGPVWLMVGFLAVLGIAGAVLLFKLGH